MSELRSPSRDLLGPADLPDERLCELISTLLGEPVLELLQAEVEIVNYALPAITTAGRWWVSGRVVTPSGPRPFRIFVKQLQNWCRTAVFATLAPEIQELAAEAMPWRSEAAVYRSDLADRLPAGLSMPRALAVVDIDEFSNAVWLEPVPERGWAWTAERFARAAHLLGRLAGSPRVAPLAQIDDHEWSVHHYLHGRLAHQVVPILRDDELWRHPLVADAFGPELRDRLRAAADTLPAWVDELAAAPHLPAHGDACPNNLLDGPTPEDFVLIDFGLWKPLPLGFDLGQLLVGDVQIGKRRADDLAAQADQLLPAYVAGLHAEGFDTDVATVRRLHALQLAVFSGVSAVPFEFLSATPTAELRQLAGDRAAIASYCLDLVEATS